MDGSVTPPTHNRHAVQAGGSGKEEMMKRTRYFVNDRGAPIGTPPTICNSLDDAHRVAATKTAANINKSADGAVWMIEVWKNGACIFDERQP